VRGILLLLLLVIVLLRVGYGLVELIALPFGGVGTLGGLILGFLLVLAVFGSLPWWPKASGEGREKALAARSGG